MEHHDILDHLNEHHLWALHYVFVPRINRALGEFVNSWNNHPIRTVGLHSNYSLQVLSFFSILNLLPWTSLTTWIAIMELTLMDPFLLKRKKLVYQSHKPI